jgi:predicted ATPase
MITRLQVRNYRSLRSVDCTLGPFQVLAGANATGKSNFLDALSLIGDIADGGLVKAISQRSSDPLDLIWFREPGLIELTVDFRPPTNVLAPYGDGRFTVFRYSLTLALGRENSYPGITVEAGSLLRSDTTDLTPVFHRGLEGRVHSAHRELAWLEQIKRKPTESVLEVLFLNTESPLLDWLQLFLHAQTERVDLRNDLLAAPSMPTPYESKLLNGENLPRLIRSLRKQTPDRYGDWLAHVTIFLPGLRDIDVIERGEDHAVYFMLQYETGLRVPSWSVSTGTLRAMALTIIPYVNTKPRLYLVEEPENGLHPTVIEAVYQSLSSVYDGQVLATSHSPILLSIVQPSEVICFSRSADGSSHVIRGDEHPVLKEWRHEVPLGTLLASGILDSVA